MVKVACWYGSTRDESVVVEYYRKLGVRYAVVDPRHVPGTRPDGPISLAGLRRMKKRLLGEGIEIACCGSLGWVRAETLDPAAGRAARRVILKNVAVLGAAGVGLANLFTMVQPPADPAGCEDQWSGLVAFYRQLADACERAGVRVGTHGSQARGQVLCRLGDYQRLLRAVRSRWLGVTACLGCLAINGDDPAKDLLALGSKVFFVHARDVIVKPDGSWVDTNLGDGQVDYVAVQRALRKTRFNGPISSEHLAFLSFEQAQEINTARAIGFLRGLFQPRPLRERK
jgi:sugar phosphate isomerase/epimerase